MELRVLGAHNMESLNTRMEAHLIDGVLALDAGGLTRSLTFEEQMGIRAVILSHRHFDHVRDILPLGLFIRDKDVTIDLYAIQDTADFISEKLLDGSLYPDFLRTPGPEKPAFRLNVVDFYKEFDVLGYRVKAVPVPHAVPAAGFQIVSGDVSLFYTGDAGRGVSDAWDHVSPTVLLTEVTFGNENEARALQAGHLTPKLLLETLTHFKAKHGRLPKVIVSHMSPPWEAAVRAELPAVAKELGLDLTISRSGMTFSLGE